MASDEAAAAASLEASLGFGAVLSATELDSLGWYRACARWGVWPWPNAPDLPLTPGQVHEETYDVYRTHVLRRLGDTETRAERSVAFWERLCGPGYVRLTDDQLQWGCWLACHNVIVCRVPHGGGQRRWKVLGIAG